MKIFIITCCLSMLGFITWAQPAITLQGSIVEETGAPVQFATVALMNPEDQTLIAGTVTDVNGLFSIKTTASNYVVEVSFIGYQKLVLTDFTPEAGVINLGEIKLKMDRQQLDKIVIEGERSQMEFRLDKRVFNVGTDLSAAGASALDVLANIPSVNVNIEGQISLRGSAGVQILVNGKPTILASDESNALGTITADMIEKVEVITNPSAKYEAEGTSGIINIVIKKEDKKGLNGSISVNTGTPDNHSVGISINRRTEKFNLFSQLGVGYRNLPREERNINRNLLSDTTIRSGTEADKYEQFYNVIIGADYHINERNVLTLSGNYMLEKEDEPSATQFSLANPTGVVSTWRREETTKATNPKYQFEFQYKSDFEDHEDHDLVISAIGSSFAKDQESEFMDTTLSGIENKDAQQNTRTDFHETKYTFKADYTKPLGRGYQVEVGGQYLLNDVGNDFSVENLMNDVWVIDHALTNNFEFTQNVLGVYSTGSFENEKWGLKLGLRIENTDISTLLVNNHESNNQNYTNLFPSAHASFKVTRQFSLQGGYSRRIYRPRMWDLNPFFNIRNNFNIRQGNPSLGPEFTDSYELGSGYDWEIFSLNLSIYHRYTTGVIERINTFENNVNIFRPENIGTNKATGLEVNAKLEPWEWMSTNVDFNYNYFDRYGELEGTLFDFSADQWTTRSTTRFKLPANLDLEASIQYESRFQTVQGEQDEMLFLDLGARKKIMKGKGVIHVSVRDVFASRIQKSTVDQADFYVFSRRLRGRFVTLGLSYGFGKGEAMSYSGSKGRR